MAKINFKLKAIRSVTVRALNGKLYNLKSGVNSFELEYKDYAALLKALGIKPKPEKKSIKQTEVSDSKELKDNESITDEKPVNDTSTTHSDETSSDEHDDESEVQEDESLDESTDESLDESADESDTLCNEQEVQEDSKEVDYASVSYTKLKAEYKRITGKQCKLKKDELIKFLQEHRDA